MLFSYVPSTWSKVGGKIIGYHQGTPNAFRGSCAGTSDPNYVDGISLTRGKNPRKHIWTFAAAADEANTEPVLCPCTNTRNSPLPPVPKFNGNDYNTSCDWNNNAAYIAKQEMQQ